MELITKIFDLDLATLVPELGKFLTDVRTLLILAMLLGPVLLVAFGGIYLLRPPAEANYRFGFRTYFGMGSIEAWQYSQRIAGIIFAGLGIVLFVVMLVVIIGMEKQDLFAMANTVLKCLLWQAGLTLAARLAATILVTVYFDANGDRRR